MTFQLMMVIIDWDYQHIETQVEFVGDYRKIYI